MERMSDPPTIDQVPAEIIPVRSPAGRLLTRADFHRLADVPLEIEWFTNLTNPQTRRATRPQ